MTSRIILDSSILVEYTKRNKTELLDYLLQTRPGQLYINSTVLSEYTYHWLGNNGQKSPRTLQQTGMIGSLIEGNNQDEFLNLFTVLPSSNAIIPLYLRLMQQYNLLPNDALILAAAKLHDIPALASYDSDFEVACTGEGLRLVRAAGDLG